MILNEFRKNQSGITLIETLVAASILIIGIVGALILTTYSIQVSEVSKQELIATNLAREGLEVVRNIRDTEWLDPSNPAWMDGIVGPGDTIYVVPIFDPATGEWTLLDITGSESNCDQRATTEACRVVFHDNDAGVDPMYLQYDSGVSSYDESDLLGYSRYIEIEDNSPDEKIHVTATVYYKGFSRSGAVFNNKIEISEDLTNWHE